MYLDQTFFFSIQSLILLKIYLNNNNPMLRVTKNHPVCPILRSTNKNVHVYLKQFKVKASCKEKFARTEPVLLITDFDYIYICYRVDALYSHVTQCSSVLKKHEERVLTI